MSAARTNSILLAVAICLLSCRPSDATCTGPTCCNTNGVPSPGSGEYGQCAGGIDVCCPPGFNAASTGGESGGNCAECKCIADPSIGCNRNVGQNQNSCTDPGLDRPAAQCAAKGGGDPVVTGWDGISMELIGKADTWFNLLSEQNHNINFHLKAAGLTTKEGGGTLMDAYAIKYKNATVQASVDEDARLTVVINNERTITAKDLETAPNHAVEINLDDDTLVIVELHREGQGNAMRLITNLIEFTVYSTPTRLDEFYQEFLPAYLNYEAKLLDHSVSAIHGVLGRTAPLAAKATKTASSSAGVKLFDGEGGEEAYIVSGPFSTDSKINYFGVEPMQSRLQIARRSMLERVPGPVHVASFA